MIHVDVLKMDSLVNIFVILLSFLCFSSGLYFHIGETEKKCFIEDIPDDTMVVGKASFWTGVLWVYIEIIEMLHRPLIRPNGVGGSDDPLTSQKCPIYGSNLKTSPARPGHAKIAIDIAAVEFDQFSLYCTRY